MLISDWLFTFASWALSFCRGHHHLQTMFRHEPVCRSAPRLSLVLCSRLPWDKHPSHFQSRPADAKLSVDAGDSKTTLKLWCWSQHVPLRVGVPQLPGVCLVLFPDTAGTCLVSLSPQPKKTWKEHGKAMCYQTAAITAKWVHKWPADESQSNRARRRDPN